MARFVLLGSMAAVASAATTSGPTVSAADTTSLSKIGTPLLQEWSRPTDAVNCGGHYAESCRVCDSSYGEVWCNGDCIWELGECVRSTPLTEAVQSGEQQLNHWPLWSGMFLLFAFLVLIYACNYKSEVVSKFPTDIFAADEEKDSDSEDVKDRNLGLCDIVHPNHCSTCLWSCCCTPVLAAKNYHVTNVMSFWPSCCAIFCTMYSPFCCCGAVLRAILSSRLQRKMGRTTSCIAEFCSSLFCPCCAVGRESREVDEAAHREVTCVFNVEKIEPKGMLEALMDEADQLQEAERSCWTGSKTRMSRACGGSDDPSENAWGFMTKKSEDIASSTKGFWGSFTTRVADDIEEAGAEIEAENKTMWQRISSALPKMNHTTAEEHVEGH